MTADLETVADLCRKLRGQTVTAQAQSLGLARATLYDWQAREPAWFRISQALQIFEALRERGHAVAIVGRGANVHGFHRGEEYTGPDLLAVLVEIARRELAGEQVSQ